MTRLVFLELYDNDFSLKRILSNIFYYRCVDHVQLMATISNLKSFVEREPRIKLIVIDSLAYPFRFVDYKDSNSQAMKTNILNHFMTTGSRHGRPPSRPITLFAAAATIIAMTGSLMRDPVTAAAHLSA